MRRTTLFGLGCGFALAVAIGTPAQAGEYDGWGDTGWIYAGKRECCNAAIALAQTYSANACINSGGVPRPPMGGGRGACSTEWVQDADGTLLYRCYAEAAVWCR